jgi:hypothetical protein
VQYWRIFLRRIRTSMPALPTLVLLAALVAGAWPHDARAEPRTVCTITVNSADERETFRRSLPPGDFDFVELVERGRPDWLASACRKGVRCDVLLISGHFDGGDEFYSDRLDARESLPVDEMERVSCSDSCPGLFSQLKEVYLFGCNTLNADALKSTSAEIVRSLVRSGHSPADAERLAQVLDARHAESNRDRMRQIFKDVPVIYGFASKAPLGRSAAPVLDRYFQAGGASEIAGGHASPKLLSLFAPVSMTVAAGVTDTEAQAAYRRDVCHFRDDRLSTEQKLGFVHELLGREMAEVRMFLDQLEKHVSTLTRTVREAAPVSKALDAIAGDRTARRRYLEFARDADQPSIRARMIALAERLGWLTPVERRAELVRMIEDRLASDDAGVADVDLICTLNRDHALDDVLGEIAIGASRVKSAGRAGILACLGSPVAHARILEALLSPKDEDVQIAQVYLRHRPLADVTELRLVAAGIARMSNSEAQVRALDALARHQLSDRESLETLTHLFPVAKTLDVQRAIAGILIRADYGALARPELVRALRQHRLKSSGGNDLIDVLIRRLQASLPPAA